AANAAPDGGAGSPKNAEPKQISIDNFKCVPDTLTVPAGTKVTWTNHDDMPHTVTSTGKPRTLDSDALDTDDQFSNVFAEPGTYTYLCTVHPKMSGQAIVEKRCPFSRPRPDPRPKQPQRSHTNTRSHRPRSRRRRRGSSRVPQMHGL